MHSAVRLRQCFPAAFVGLQGGKLRQNSAAAMPFDSSGQSIFLPATDHGQNVLHSPQATSSVWAMHAKHASLRRYVNLPNHPNHPANFIDTGQTRAWKSASSIANTANAEGPAQTQRHSDRSSTHTTSSIKSLLQCQHQPETALSNPTRHQLLCPLYPRQNRHRTWLDGSALREVHSHRLRLRSC